MRQIELIQKYSDVTDQQALRYAVEKTAESIRLSPTPNKKKREAFLESSGRILEGTALLEGKIPQTFYANYEAIVLERMRPAWLIDKDEIIISKSDESDNYPLEKQVRCYKEQLQDSAKRVGRVDIVNFYKSFVGTGWLIEDDIVVTNAHVVREYLRKGSDYELAPGINPEDSIEVKLNFNRQYSNIQDKSQTVELIDILFVAQKGQPDIAFLKVGNSNGRNPLSLLSHPIRERTPVAAIGYPAEDKRNDRTVMRRIFGDKYQVKRFSPGFINIFDTRRQIYLGDYSSLGGSSGSALLTIENSPKVAGLHFAGEFKQANFSVPSDLVLAALRAVNTRVQVPHLPPDIETESSQFCNREGYDPNFLGTNNLSVPLPDYSNWKEQMARLKTSNSFELKYTHFSVFQCAQRRLPLFTAVNIDGAKFKILKRKGSWRLDGRISSKDQIGNQLYKNNDLDRGHMVRRMDPGWGNTEVAQQAELDTFHFTNSVPQHKDLNQKSWLGLEDYILRSAHAKGFKLSVFTGPVFKDSDTSLRFQPKAFDVKIPKEFWKITIMVNEGSGSLSATGYILSQGDMIRGMLESAFVLGEYKTYQVEISLIEQYTHLNFGVLSKHDPLAAKKESVFGHQAIEIRDPEDLRLC